MTRDKSESETLTSQLARKGLAGTIGQVTSRGLQFGFLLLLARILSPHNYGLFVLGWTVVMLAQSIGGFGLQKGLVKLVAEYETKDDDAGVRGTILSATVVSMIFATAIAAAIFVTSEPVAITLFRKPRLDLVFGMLALLVPFWTFTLIASAVSQAFRNIRAQQLILNERMLLPLVFVGAIGLLGYEFTHILLGTVTASMAAAVVAAFVVWRTIPIGLRGKRSATVSQLLAVSIPMFLSGFIYSLLFRIDQLILGLFVTASEVGFYNAGSVLASQLSVILLGIATVFEPTASKLHSGDQNKELSLLYSRAAVWTLIATAPIAAVVWGLPELLLSLFGTEFVSAEPMLLILTLYALVRTAIGPTGELLQMTGYQKLILYDTFAMVVLNIALNLLLIPTYGGIGAAVATAVSITSVELLVLYQVYLRLDMHPFSRTHAIATTVCVMLLGASLWLNWYDVTYVVRGGVLVVLFAGYATIIWNLVLKPAERERLKGGLRTVFSALG